MLRGERVVLRAFTRDDAVAMSAVRDDPESWPAIDPGPFVPFTADDAMKKYDERQADPAFVRFAVEVDGAFVGDVVLWGIDLHNRWGHLGIKLLPDARGRGYGTDACRVLLDYAFVDRGLHRVQLECLATNEAGLAAYRKAGFREEGRLRESAWVRGRWVDEVVMGVLATEHLRGA